MDASSVRVPGRAPRWIVPTVKVFLVSADAIAATLSFIIAFMYREGVSAFDGQWRWSNQFAPYGTLLILVVAIRLLSLRYVNDAENQGFVEAGRNLVGQRGIGHRKLIRYFQSLPAAKHDCISARGGREHQQQRRGNCQPCQNTSPAKPFLER